MTDSSTNPSHPRKARSFWRTGFILAGLATGALCLFIYKVGFGNTATVEQAKQIKLDQAAVRVYREGLQRVVEYVEKTPALFPETKLSESRILKREEKEQVWAAWKRYLDYLVALDALSQRHAGYWKLDGAEREELFLIAYAAHAAKHRFTLQLVHRLASDPGFDTMLNEPVPELGLPSGVFAKLKFRFVNVITAGEFAAWEAIYKADRGRLSPELRAIIDADAEVIWNFGKGRGEKLLLKNALQIVKSTARRSVLPAQASISEWMGDTKVARLNRSLISAEQIAVLLPKLEPGDILLERRSWYLSNIGLPGFWPHAALFIGTPEVRKKFFDDVEVREWVKTQGRPDGDFEGLLLEKYPQAYALGIKPQEHDHRPRLLEAISEGVSFTTIEHSADCDTLAALRPRLSKLVKARAILRAFHFAGRPYDFDFDFQTDSALVCTELVCKAYEPVSNQRGLTFPLSEVLGRQVASANDMVRQFDEQFGTSAQQVELVAFLDGVEKENRAVVSDVAGFRASHKRPKWFNLLQEGSGKKSDQ